MILCVLSLLCVVCPLRFGSPRVSPPSPVPFSPFVMRDGNHYGTVRQNAVYDFVGEAMQNQLPLPALVLCGDIRVLPNSSKGTIDLSREPVTEVQRLLVVSARGLLCLTNCEPMHRQLHGRRLARSCAITSSASASSASPRSTSSPRRASSASVTSSPASSRSRLSSNTSAR